MFFAKKYPKAGEAKSIIDRKQKKLILRDFAYSETKNKGMEWVVQDGVIIVNSRKKLGISTETIQISSISEVETKVQNGGAVGYIDIHGGQPERWISRNVINGSDIFVLHAISLYIQLKRQSDNSNPLRLKLDSVVEEMARQVYVGERNIADLEEFRERGIHWLEPSDFELFGFENLYQGEAKKDSAVSTPEPPVIVHSVADEVSKLKALLDDGILTQEEFEHKKKVLLGM